MIRSCGAALGFFAFSVTIVLGMTAGNPVSEILIRAIQALFLFFLLGLMVGWVAYRVIDEHAIRRHRELFPAEDPLAGATDSTDSPARRQADVPQPDRR